MADTDTISFHCPSCSCKLNVPAAMSGVSGPCPNCNTTIIAPAQSPSAANVETAAVHIPSDQIRAAAQLIRGSARTETQSEEQAQEPMPAPQAASKKIEPKIHYRDVKAATTSAESLRSNEPSVRKPGLLSFIVPSAFAAAALVLVATLLHAVGVINVWDIQRDLSQRSGEGAAEVLDEVPDPSEPLAIQSPPPAENSDAEIESASLPDSTAIQVVQSETAPLDPKQTDTPSEPESVTGLTQENDSQGHQELAQETTASANSPKPPIQKPKNKRINPVMANIMEQGEFPELKLSPSAPVSKQDVQEETKPTPVRKAGYFARGNLEAFLEAKTLAERLPYVLENQRSPARWQNSSLELPFRPVRSIRLLETSTGAETSMIQHLYMVSFEDTTQERDRQHLIILLEEHTGKHPPLIKADAFLQHYDEMLTKYADKPSGNATTFHCYAETQTSDFIKDLPDGIGNSMVRFIIKNHPYYPAKFDAYLDENSPLMTHVGNGKDLPYTISKRCILSFKWNTTDPEHPYIEVADIVSSRGW